MKKQLAHKAGERTSSSANLKQIPCNLAVFEQLSSEILRAGNSLRFQAHGASMIPLVRDGDVLLIKPVQPESLRPGDVALCSLEPGRVVVHRIVCIEKTSAGLEFLVQGDHSPEPDGKIGQAQVLGKLISIDRHCKHIEMESPVARTLSRVAAMRLRWKLDHYWLTRSAGLALKNLPVFYRFF